MNVMYDKTVYRTLDIAEVCHELAKIDSPYAHKLLQVSKNKNFKCFGHDDKKPSMGVAYNRCHCFSCSKNYNPIEIAMLVLGFEPTEYFETSNEEERRKHIAKVERAMDLLDQHFHTNGKTIIDDNLDEEDRQFLEHQMLVTNIKRKLQNYDSQIFSEIGIDKNPFLPEIIYKLEDIPKTEQELKAKTSYAGYCLKMNSSFCPDGYVIESKTAPQFDVACLQTLYALQNPKPIKVNSHNVDTDYTDYYKKCRDNITSKEALDYLTQRGISVNTAKKYWIGFDAKCNMQFDEYQHPRIIIPCSKSFFIGRSIKAGTKDSFKALNVRYAPRSLFNKKALKSSVVFVTEGAFDALSFMEIGKQALSLNTTNNIKELVKIIKQEQPNTRFVLCLDNDNAGIKAQDELAKYLSEIGASYICYNVAGEYNDPNDCLKNNRALFEANVNDAYAKAIKLPESNYKKYNAQYEKEIVAKKAILKTLAMELYNLLTENDIHREFSVKTNTYGYLEAI